ncbi:S1 family peptidase [Lusitaniella coriacea]|uniref:S1 family peptidase n=1 Tax=Lusitaniella coriacea TaxID=1983105 RepID=UPI003CF3AE8B
MESITVDLCLLLAIACSDSLSSVLSARVLALDSCSPVLIEEDPSELSPEQLGAIARAIVVRVNANSNKGSGILVSHQGSIYTVLTNQHVLTPGEPYQIETSDGQRHPATPVDGVDFQGNDLALLQFRSGIKRYQTATLGNSSHLKIGEAVFAAGFPSESKEFALNSGQVALSIEPALIGGYQMGYTNPIHKGMSGGPLLNQQGKVVGINGIHQYPFWGNPYVFNNRTHPPLWLRKWMVHFSWGIPAETSVQLAPQFFSSQGDISERSFCSETNYQLPIGERVKETG